MNTKIMKRILASVMVSVLSCTSPLINTSAYSISNVADVDLGLDTTDVILASHYFLASSQSDMNFWNNDLSDIEIVPLYNTEGSVSAYYVELTDDTAYAVINNNIENPTAIEFGQGCNPLIREILDNTDDPHIIYNNPLSVYNVGEIMMLSENINTSNLYDNYPDLSKSNPELADVITQQKNILENTPMPCGDGDYGFIDVSNMPSGANTSCSINNYAYVDWVSTGETSSYASNHCGSVAVANLALYFVERGKTNLMVDNDRIETFKAVHNVVGNGPKATIADDAEEYFNNRGYNLEYYTDRSVSLNNRIAAENEAIRNNRPCGLLLEDDLNSWHWVIAVGYKNYTSGDKYFQIVDGWSNNASRYYKPGVGSAWISMTEYWVV